jgi:multiple sugar transport system permease protein
VQAPLPGGVDVRRNRSKLRRKRKLGSGIERMERRWGILLAMPAILGFVLINLGPMIASFFVGLTDWRIGGSPEFIGISNFRELFAEDRLFRKSLFVTSYYTLGSVPLVMICAFFVAMLLNQKVKGLPVFRTIFYLPVLVPSIANAMLWLWIYNPDFGLFNSVLRSVGLPGSPWLYNEHTAVPSIILMSSWAMGNAMIIFLAGLQGVPNHLFEAIEVDGGNAYHKLRYITIPMMTPVIFFNLVMALINTFQVFNEAYIMTNGGPNNATLFYVFYLYRKAFQETQMGYASALAWILFIIILLLTLLVFRSAKKWVYYEGGR